LYREDRTEMDNSNNNGLEYGDNSDMSDKKPHRKGFRNGFGVGIATGIVTTIVLGLIVLFAYTMITGRSVHTVAKSADVLDDKTVQKIDELANYIDEYYYEDYDKDDLGNGLLHGVMEGLNDPYSVYYTADEYKELQISTTGTYYGIGAALKQDPNTKRVTVSKVYSGTPSEEAGLKKDDEIVSVDGVEATSEDLTKLVAKIRGKEGTKVTLEIRRGEEADPFTVEVERKNVELPSVDSKLLDNGVGYIQVSEFQTNTASQFEDALEGLTNQGMKGLIVDLRANPGGLLTAVTEMVDRLLPTETVGKLPAGTVVYTKDKSGNVQTFGDDDGKQIDCPIVVLVDENSASASEIFAGAMKDYNEDGYIDATLVGKKTFGKGIVQTIYNLSDGDAVKITTSKYYTPNGHNIHKKGIEPDVEVDYEYTGDTNADYDMQYDVQLQKAIEVMNEKLK
jgi:carboxyl-terminal processing protease